ncbi:peptide N-acetyl-beta-D-glucosaminyl asparaginase amidase A-domain-containing protein [Lactarius akahatsu]|uniref:Peptide N-acetyl-beta-D-glucosaminyl asparaginase amidase A-domain-containing protein n=1 Tax=Lactarius akahatsu TaxID=416441 RepID=A0AAD4L672_9AGAM|nr:peptide N-acetyl-beta-D-glucosaminyl asparaginase amidase A-domain-containing protein [Lactarius akahatsu]
MSQSTPFLQSLLSLLLLLLCTNYALCDPLVNFQVAQPPPFILDSESLQCTTTIIQRTFGSSIGDPEIVKYTPPTGCSTPDVWAGITLNFTVTSNGTQLPRFAFFTFQNVEIWRSSTSIPNESGADGIVWTYVKDVTRFIPLFSQPGTFILQLDNVVQTGLDGEFAVTLEATIFSGSSRFPPAQRADLIIPLTTLANNTGDEASVPPGFSLEVTLPRNAVTAFAELQASANGDDMFWYSNPPNQFLSYFPDGIISEGPFREVRVLVDGQVAGVAFPYAFLSTGTSPAAWRPIAPYGALDMPTYHLDLTPFIPILTNGQPHNITLDVASAESDHHINENWYLSGLLQVNLDSSTLPTTGNITLYQAEDYALSTVTGSNDSDINIIVNASRSIHIEAEIIAGSGEQTKVVFTQNLEYGNVQNYPQHDPNPQQVFQIASGETLSTHNGETALQDTFTYPLLMDSAMPGTGALWSQIDQSYDRELHPAPFIMGTTIVEHQVAAGTVNTIEIDNFGSNGTSSNTFNYIDTEGNTYTRQVNASGSAITFDNQGGTLAPKAAS